MCFSYSVSLSSLALETMTGPTPGERVTACPEARTDVL